MRLILLLNNKLRHVSEMSFVMISAADVKPVAADAALCLPHVGALHLVLFKIMPDDAFDNAGWCAE